MKQMIIDQQKNRHGDVQNNFLDYGRSSGSDFFTGCLSEFGVFFITRKYIGSKVKSATIYFIVDGKTYSGFDEKVYAHKKIQIYQPGETNRGYFFYFSPKKTHILAFRQPTRGLQVFYLYKLENDSLRSIKINNKIMSDEIDRILKIDKEDLSWKFYDFVEWNGDNLSVDLSCSKGEGKTQIRYEAKIMIHIPTLAVKVLQPVTRL
jgi:hypothetical protein